MTNRKYLSRDETKSHKETPDEPKKEIFLEKTRIKSSTKEDLGNLSGDIKNVDEYVNSLNRHIIEQREKIENMKKTQSNFEKQLEMLTSGEIPIPIQTDKEFDSLGKELNLGNGSESDKIIGNITSIVEKEIQNRILVLQSQLVEEKKNSDEFRTILEQNLKKFNRIEKNLRVEKAKLENEIKEKTDKLNEIEKVSAIGDLASRLAYDLKNPLSVIKGTIQMIKRTDSVMDEITKKRIELIEGATFRMTHQIEDVLGYVRVTPLKKKPASLNEIIVSALHSLMIPTNITINFPKEDIVFLCDSQKLQIVFTNIILNSIQAIGDNKGIINIRAKKHQDTIAIKIEDTGSGIPSGATDKIFDPLFTTKQDAMGLGLACCKNIVEQHKGKMSVAENPTAFLVVLPLF